MTNPQQTLSSMAKNWKPLLLKSETRQWCPLSPLLFNTVLDVLATALREEKEIKEIQIGKEVKLSLFGDDMILCPKDTTRKLLELIDNYSKVVGYKINAQKSLVFVYTKNDKEQETLRKQSHSPLQWKEKKYLGINLPEEIKDLYHYSYLENPMDGGAW